MKINKSRVRINTLELMKANKTLLIALSILLSLPFFNACKRGENDPWLSLKSRNSRISAVWTLESGYHELFETCVTEFRYLDDECEDAEDGLGNPLPQEWEDERILSKQFNYSDALATYNQSMTTTEEDLIDPTVNLPVSKNEYEDAYSKANVQINYDYELTIKKNGEYKIYITYNYFDSDVPVAIEPDGEERFGKTYSGTFEYVDNWHWTDNSLGTKEGIMFDGFPLPVVEFVPVYDLTQAPTDIFFTYNYVTGINFTNNDMIFELDKLASKEMTMMAFNNENFYYQEQDTEYEAVITGSSEKIDCLGTYTETNVNNANYYFQFISDGKSVDE